MIKMKLVFAAIAVFVVSVQSVWATELPKACTPPATMDQEDFIIAWVAETTRKGSQQQIKDANSCLWKLWPTRDGAFVRVLVDNFLYLADRDLTEFLQVAAVGDDFASLCKNIQTIGFVARSSSELKYLISLRKSLLSKTMALTKLRISKVELHRVQILRKALIAIDVREIQ